ncbi:MbcA/ParS/Xre antitoxin family protein [Pseudomonas sp. HN2-3]|uniref:MbcA/ParS/Xre antitoxin family protein n=1 Tax=Pseudomonas sp. HN2-3 TaxID=2886360 RepID=UPI001D1146DF|nr:MbcA/ParS/Xre antitoxin family protein [Pseudomonas sp. HN2-3]UDU79078.1 MbcA/ParS/Xre antitoxin family protein [Pseudomonas sp. HN2-3]
MQDFDLVWQKAEQVFGDKAKAAVWLSTPKQLFGGLTAIDYVRDQETLPRVIEVLAQIEHGYP